MRSSPALAGTVALWCLPPVVMDTARGPVEASGGAGTREIPTMPFPEPIKPSAGPSRDVFRPAPHILALCNAQKDYPNRLAGHPSSSLQSSFRAIEPYPGLRCLPQLWHWASSPQLWFRLFVFSGGEELESMDYFKMS